MKCPKCGYLGFETGDQCRNCGYDFSLIAVSPRPADPELTIRTDDAESGAPELWLDRLDRSMDAASRPTTTPDHLQGIPEPSADPAAPGDHALPLFNPDDPDDIPLIALPTAPRQPLSVRRAAESPRLRAVPKTNRLPAPVLEFLETGGETAREETVAGPRAAGVSTMAGPPRNIHVTGRRVTAALIDASILLAIDLVVVYFTVRMAGLNASEVRLLPMPPLMTFLGLLKFAYFSAFTAVGGQTIGKMAVRIQVVTDSGRLDSARAVNRTLVSVFSLLPFGLGLLPVFFGDRRALHDRLTGTRVVELPSA